MPYLLKDDPRALPVYLVPRQQAHQLINMRSPRIQLVAAFVIVSLLQHLRQKYLPERKKERKKERKNVFKGIKVNSPLLLVFLEDKGYNSTETTGVQSTNPRKLTDLNIPINSIVF
jgi:hypothetical protein